jgi:hypothetical protein
MIVNDDSQHTGSRQSWSILRYSSIIRLEALRRNTIRVTTAGLQMGFEPGSLLSSSCWDQYMCDAVYEPEESQA